MTEPHKKEKPYDLEERTYAFALEVRLFLRNTRWDPVSWPDIKQVLRSSGSVSANWVEAKEAISPADYLYRVRIYKKEVRETGIWLRLIGDSNPIDEAIHRDLDDLVQETTELVKTFMSIITKKSAEDTLP